MNVLASSSSEQPPLPPRRSGNASRFLLSIRKSISHTLTPSRKRNTDDPHGGIGMYSTLEEREPCVPSRMHPRYRDFSTSRPTIEQIAMGLHVSRTPHLRNPSHQSYSSPSSLSHTRHPNARDLLALHRPTHSLPLPPSRSSLKKSGTSTTLNSHPPKSITSLGASPSPTVTSTGAAADDGRSQLSLKLRVSKLFLRYRSAPPSSRITSMASSGSGSEGTRPTTPRKSVRFSTSVLVLDDENITNS